MGSPAGVNDVMLVVDQALFFCASPGDLVNIKLTHMVYDNTNAKTIC